MTAPKSPSAGGKPPRRAVTATKASAAIVKVGTTTASRPSSKKVSYAHDQQDMLTWEKKSSGAWVSGQSMGINPGDPRAITRLRHSKKFVARGKKVIRPRTKKVIHTD